ncbi:TPA: hypothetical protein ACKQAS_002998 [Stenotrophomonas maltophilia]
MEESIGSVSTGNYPDDEGWIFFALELAKSYILLVCGDPPPETQLDLIWSEHDYGSLPSLGVISAWRSLEVEKYICRSQAALENFDKSVEWHSLKGYYYETLDSPDK